MLNICPTLQPLDPLSQHHESAAVQTNVSHEQSIEAETRNNIIELELHAPERSAVFWLCGEQTQDPSFAFSACTAFNAIASRFSFSFNAVVLLNKS